jgi:xanthine dehydrogenase molybdenum-binding subunit
MRGYGNPEATWPIESTLDELAEMAGIGPFEIRMINRNEPGETTPMGLQVGTCGMQGCLEETAKRLDWKRKKSSGRKARRGVGIASLMHVGGSGRIYRSDGGGVILKLDDFGNVNVSYGGVEMGQGLHSALSLTVAEAFGIPPDRVTVNQTDTATCPWDVGTHASRGAFISCNAALMAAEKIKERIYAAAEAIFPAEVEKNLKHQLRYNPDYRPPNFDVNQAAKAGNFILKEGYVCLRDAPTEPHLRVELGRMLRAMHFRGREGEMLTEEVFYEPNSELPDWKVGKGNLSAAYAYGVQGAEVEVDEETGEVKILKMVAVHDVGRVLNPQTLSGQIYGALAQGIGYALYEELRSEEGRIANPSFRDYKIPTVHEMSFPIEIDFVETDEPEGPFGAKGVGEPGLVPTAPAIANAIYDAVGVRIRDLPITPEKILAALRKESKL